jgi:hypothetical protein
MDAVYVAPCESYTQAKVVAANAKARGDQSHVRINTTKPRPRPWWILQLMGPDDNRPWYTPGAFS